MASGPLNLFPPNGLDTSLHASVFVGLALMTFFTEVFGFSYGGLVVPGYLATVLLAAPVTGALIIFESVATYLFVFLVGDTVVKTGAWSTTFGRERFFLFLVGAVLVRLGVEGTLVPWAVSRHHLTHARELYSIGLVLVPLLANSIWNVGLRQGAPRMALVTALTFLVLKYVFVRFTNLSVAAFQLNNESVSRAFLDTPKEQIILLFGALLGARNNVQYGWDYNGILVPGLLAVSWFQPTKLATSVVEAIALYLVLRALVSIRPLSRMLIVGPRRMLLAYSVGFLFKLLIGFVVFRIWPEVRMADFYGFGYLLPTLIAVKIWNKERIGIVLMPALQVSLVAFVLGSAIGFGLAAVDQRVATAADGAYRRETLETADSIPWVLMQGDSAPLWGTPDELWHKHAGAAFGAVLDIAEEIGVRGGPGDVAMARFERVGVRLQRSADGGDEWITMVPRTFDPDEIRSAPRVALRRQMAQQGGFAVLVETPRAGSSFIAAAHRIATLLRARAIVLLSHFESLRKQDEKFAEQILARLSIPNAIIVRPGERAAVAALGAVPSGLDIGALSKELGTDFELSFQSIDEAPTYLPAAARLMLPASLADRVGADVLGAPPVERWPGSWKAELGERLEAMTRVGRRGYEPPSIEELRLFRAVVWSSLQGLRDGRTPSAWERAVAHRLGYAFADAGDAELKASVLFEPPGDERRGHASLFVLPRRPAKTGRSLDNPSANDAPRSALLVEVPAPRWEIGAAGAGVAFAAGLDAGALLLAGALPNQEPLGAADVRRTAARRSFYQTIHESWLDESNGHVVALNGTAPERDSRDRIICSFGREVIGADAVPNWSRPLLGALTTLGFPVGMYDGSAGLAPLSGASDVGMAYAERFAPDRMGIFWLSAPLRARFALAEQGRTGGRLVRAKLGMTQVDVASRAWGLANDCVSQEVASRRGTCPFAPRDKAACEIDAVSSGFDVYATEENPFELRSVARDPRGCHLEIVRDVEGAHFALVAGAGRVRILPLEVRGAPLHPSTSVRSVEALRTAVSIGLTAAEVEVGP